MRFAYSFSLVLSLLVLPVVAHSQAPAEAAPPADPAAAQPAPVPEAAPLAAPALEPVPAPTPVSIEPTAPTEAAPTAPPPPEAAPPAPTAPTQLKIELPNGNSIRFGLLWQLQYEAKGNPANKDLSHNIFLRRFALLVGGTVLHDFEYFWDSDFADLLKSQGEDGFKNGPGISTKDAFVTYKGLGDEFKIEGGLLMPALSHNVLQGGASLYSWDFFFNTFRHAGAFGSTGNTYGRDLGLQLRGLVAEGLLEYRAGIFQGKRGAPVAGPPPEPGSKNFFRLTGRLQLNLLDPETGFFYAGSYLGTKKILSFGAFVDFQPGVDDGDAYYSWGVDGFLDLPIGEDGITAQVNLVDRNGGDLIDLPQQTFVGGELGYRIGSVDLSPIARLEHRFAPGEALDETDVGLGLAWWPYDHNANLKAFYTRVIPSEADLGYDQFNVQWQLAFY